MFQLTARGVRIFEVTICDLKAGLRKAAIFPIAFTEQGVCDAVIRNTEQPYEPCVQRRHHARFRPDARNDGSHTGTGATPERSIEKHVRCAIPRSFRRDSSLDGTTKDAAEADRILIYSRFDLVRNPEGAGIGYPSTREIEFHQGSAGQDRQAGAPGDLRGGHHPLFHLCGGLAGEEEGDPCPLHLWRLPIDLEEICPPLLRENAALQGDKPRRGRVPRQPPGHLREAKEQHHGSAEVSFQRRQSARRDR